MIRAVIAVTARRGNSRGRFTPMRFATPGITRRFPANIPSTPIRPTIAESIPRAGLPSGDASMFALA